MKMTATSLDADGLVVDHKVTKEDWCLSELQIFIDEMKLQLYRGEIEHILLGLKK